MVEIYADNGMRVGADYQAVIPEILSADEYNIEQVSEKALLIWKPSPEVLESKVDDFLIFSKEQYGYTAEQALGMIFWHKYDLEKASCDLPNFTPFADDWSVEDRVLFEQAFQFHGKCFLRIRQMLPDKSIASLIKYYYSWKKTRSKTSLMDRQARKRASHRGDGLDAGSEEGSNSESDFEVDHKDKDMSGIGVKTTCANCSSSTTQAKTTSKGSLCPSCFHYWKRTGSMKPSGGVKKDVKDRHGIVKSKRKAPRGMYLSHEDLKSIATGPVGQGEAILKSLDSEVVSLKRQIQHNKQIISSLKLKTTSGIDEFRPTEPSGRCSSRWTGDEMLLAVQGIRRYGKDFKTIAEVIGTKAEVHIKSFFATHQRRYNLSNVLKEFETENGTQNEVEGKDEKMDVDGCTASNSNSGTSTPVTFATSAAVAQSTNPMEISSSNNNNSSSGGNSGGVNTNTTSNSSNNSNGNPPALTSVPPPLLKPVQSPSIMNRSQAANSTTNIFYCWIHNTRTATNSKYKISNFSSCQSATTIDCNFSSIST
ncbi:hypothetical protein CHUAL_011324 [Chamberlinius hualienensis]